MALQTNMSFSIQPEKVEPINERFKELGLNSRSEYIRTLIDEDLPGEEPEVNIVEIRTETDQSEGAA